MRFVLKVEMPAESANAVIKSGKLGALAKQILDEQKPEAVYFTEMDGQRTALVVLNLADESELVRYAEPWWLTFGGRVEWHPAMVPADLMKAEQFLESAAKNYG